MTTKKPEAETSAQTNDAPAASASAATTHYATRDFKDAGSERRFTKGAELTDLKPELVANYAAAGLASTERPAAE